MDFYTKIVWLIFYSLYSIYIKLIFLLHSFYPNFVKEVITFIFKRGFGITINGPEPTDIKVLNPEKFYVHALAYFDLGVFESYLNEECTVEDLAGLYGKFINSKNYGYFSHPMQFVSGKLNLQMGDDSWKVAQVHYDGANEVIETMLDENMQYSCGYWRNATNLNDAQIAKMDLIAAKLHLQPGMRVLDLGCGYGTLACYLAKNYGVSVVGCTISKEQIKYGKVASEGLPVELQLRDYREMDGKFDRIVTVGFVEHVGSKNLRSLMKVAHNCLKDDGIFLVHTIGVNHNKGSGTNAILSTYIFPNSELPYYLDIAKAFENLFIIEDWHNFGIDYSKTIKAWEEKFEKAWPQLKEKYDKRFYNMWKGYLAGCWALFHTRSGQLWQIVLTKNGLKDGYISIR